MIYLCSKFPCVIFDGSKSENIQPCIFYEITNIKNEWLLCVGNQEVPFTINFYEVLNLNENNKNIVKIKIKSDTFIFLNAKKQFKLDFQQFKSGNKQVNIILENSIVIRVNNELAFEKELETEINFSHIEEFLDFKIVYFVGIRNFIVIIQNGEIKFADYYDEINIDNDEKFFMARQNDLLNHGKVASIKNGKFETYLVYLDDFELKMKNEFVFLVFLDCFLCGNIKYCNELLSEDIKQSDCKNIKNFFEEFDNYIPFKNLAFLFKKNTLTGVCKFEVSNNKIENIIHLMPFG